MTRETMLLCEAAGFDVVLVETVGIGQSETVVAGMVDFFLALMLPGAGDELQGIKKGLLEVADLIAVNKADGDNLLRARQAVQHYRNALRIIEPESPSWRPPVLAVSALTGRRLGRAVGGGRAPPRAAGGLRRAGREAPRPAGGVDVVDAGGPAAAGAAGAAAVAGAPAGAGAGGGGRPADAALAAERVLETFGVDAASG